MNVFMIKLQILAGKKRDFFYIQWLEICKKGTMIQRPEGYLWNMRKPNAQTACCKNKICHGTLGVNYQPQATS